MIGDMVRNFKRYKRALERIAHHEVTDPVNEWSEAEAYGDVKDIALEALEPGMLLERARVEKERVDRLRERVKQLRKESSAGKRHFYNSFNGEQGAIVCVLNTKLANPELVEVKIEQIVGGWMYRSVDGRFKAHVSNLYDSPEAFIKYRDTPVEERT